MILDEIVLLARERAARLPGIQETLPSSSCKSLKDAILAAKGKIAVIAEMKCASPSAGPIRENIEIEKMAADLERGGCIAASVLTEPAYFRGDTAYIARAKRGCTVPVLRKDFIVDERQLFETAALGADAVLLIAGILKEELPHFVRVSWRLGIEPLVEVHNQDEALMALQTDAVLIGINNRDLGTMEIDLDTTLNLSERIHQEGRLVISESGVRSADDIRRLKKHCDAFLIGTAIMASDDPGKKLEEFVFA